MRWNETFTQAVQPNIAQIDEYITSPLWQELRRHLEETYSVTPVIEHSICSAAPGWNIKYKKSGRSLCTVYPDANRFTCMVTIGAREAVEAELLLPCCTDAVRELYWRTTSINSARWLMIEVDSPETLRDVKELIATRVHSKQKK